VFMVTIVSDCGAKIYLRLHVLDNRNKFTRSNIGLNKVGVGFTL
jgi:hypothetical protein